MRSIHAANFKLFSCGYLKFTQKFCHLLVLRKPRIVRCVWAEAGKELLCVANSGYDGPANIIGLRAFDDQEDQGRGSMREVSKLIDDSWRTGWVEVIAVSANSIPKMNAPLSRNRHMLRNDDLRYVVAFPLRAQP